MTTTSFDGPREVRDETLGFAHIVIKSADDESPPQFRSRALRLARERGALGVLFSDDEAVVTRMIEVTHDSPQG